MTTEEKNEQQLERRHLEEFKGVARGLEESEKLIVLKTIPTKDLLDELNRRMTLLENRDQKIRELYRITTKESDGA